MFCASGLVFGCSEGVGSRFHVLRARTRFQKFRGRRVPFSCFASPDSFSTVLRASGLVFMFCAPGLVFGGTDCVVSRFHVLRYRTRFRRFRGCRVPFSCFARPDSFSAVPRVSDPVFMFCATGLIFGGTEGVRSRFHVFACPDSFLAVSRASGPLFMFCAPRIVFDGAERVGFSCFALPDPFSALPGASGPVFMFCTPELFFGDIDGVASRFHVLRARTRFQRHRGLRVPFSCFPLPDMFLGVPRASGPFFTFRAPGLVFGGTEGVGSHFHVLRSRTRFRRCRVRRVLFSFFARSNSFFVGSEGVGSCFHILRYQTRFQWYRGRWVLFSRFALPGSFSAVPRASGPLFMFCAPGLVFVGAECVGSRFHVLRARARFQRYRGRRVPFSCFALPDSFSTVPSASGPVFMF
jgi:hypothetical protein